MPKYKQGNMWDALQSVDIFCITTNQTIKNNGAVVMGRGIAREVRDYIPGIDKLFGTWIHDKGPGPYGFLTDGSYGIFQVKYHFAHKAQEELIAHSCSKLIEYLNKHKDLTVALNYPGIGNGGLNKRQVEKYIQHLPRNVQVWSFD